MQIVIQLPGRGIRHVKLLPEIFRLKNAQEKIDSLLLIIVGESVAVIPRDALKEIVRLGLQPRGDTTV